MYEKQFDGDYIAVAASKTQVLTGQFGSGKAGDFIGRIIIIPATTGPGAVTLADGADAAITLLPGGVASITELKPIVVELNARSCKGAWKIVTGANVSVVAVGRFQ